MYFSSAFNFFLDTTCYHSMSANIIPSLCYHLVTNKQEINDCALLNIYWQQSHSCKSLSAFILHHVDNGATFVIFQQLWHVLAPFLYQGILLYSNTGTEFIHWFTKVKDGPLSQWQSSYTSVKQHNVSGYGRLFNWMFGNKCIGWYDMKRVMLIELFYVVKRHCVICKLDLEDTRQLWYWITHVLGMLRDDKWKGVSPILSAYCQSIRCQNKFIPTSEASGYRI